MCNRSIEAPVVHQQDLGGGANHLVLKAPAIAAGAIPGQFLHVRAGEGYDPLLRRPLSVHQVDRPNGTVSLLYQVRGRGTAWLARRRPGERLDVLGPLGNGFPEPAAGGACLLVGGGLGVAPLFFLAEYLRRRGREIVFLAGANRATGLYRLAALQGTGVTVMVATEDGSAGYHGLVTGLLADRLYGQSPAALYACGPWEMLAAVAAVGEERDVPTFVSLEAMMACGTGLCRGCAVPVYEADAGEIRYVRACTEGPVLPAGKVAWHAS